MGLDSNKYNVLHYINIIFTSLSWPFQSHKQRIVCPQQFDWCNQVRPQASAKLKKEALQQSCRALNKSQKQQETRLNKNSKTPFHRKVFLAADSAAACICKPFCSPCSSTWRFTLQIWQTCKSNQKCALRVVCVSYSLSEDMGLFIATKAPGTEPCLLLSIGVAVVSSFSEPTNKCPTSFLLM